MQPVKEPWFGKLLPKSKVQPPSLGGGPGRQASPPVASSKELDQGGLLLARPSVFARLRETPSRGILVPIREGGPFQRCNAIINLVTSKIHGGPQVISTN